MADTELLARILSIETGMEQINGNETVIGEMQTAIAKNIQTLESHGEDIRVLKESIAINAYSKTEMDRYMIAWKVEEIAHVFDTPTNEMFEKTNLDELAVGYMHFYEGNINESHDHHIRENSMRRYTISAYSKSLKTVTFRVFFADRLRVYADGIEIATHIDAQGNFGRTEKVITLALKEGWTKIQFLISNETQQGGLVFSSDLFRQADYLANLDYMYGMIGGNRVLPGSLDETHFSPNMDMVVRTLHATASSEPGVIVGDPNGCGILQIGDQTISKCLDEPFVFSDGIRVDGFIRASQLLLDVDILRAGKGIMVDKIKDPETGYTKMYEIINDLRLVNGGGMIIEGNGQDGYTVTNDVKIKGHPDGGINVEGNGMIGFEIQNTMELEGEGIDVEGNATDGYKVINATRIDERNGIDVTKIKNGEFEIANTLEITGDRILVESTGDEEEGFSSYHLTNDTLVDSNCDGIQVEKIANGHFRLTNSMSLTEMTTTGSVNITGDACAGYKIEGYWPTISESTGIDVTNPSPGVYTIANTGVLKINAGTGIGVNRNTGDVTVTNRGVVGLTASGMATATGSPGGTYNVHVPLVQGYIPMHIFSEYNWQAGLFEDNPGGPSGFKRNTQASTEMFYYIKFIPTTSEPKLLIEMGGGKSAGGTGTVVIRIQDDAASGANGGALGIDETHMMTLSGYVDGPSYSMGERKRITIDGSGWIGKEMIARLSATGGAIIKMYDVRGISDGSVSLPSTPPPEPEPEPEPEPTPEPVSLNKVETVSRGADHSLFLLDNGSLYATGVNEDGQFGDGTIQASGAAYDTMTPRLINWNPGSEIVAVSAGTRHSAFVTAAGKAYGAGHLYARTPQEVAMPSNVIGAYADFGYTLFLLDNGDVYKNDQSRKITLPSNAVSLTDNGKIVLDNGQIYTLVQSQGVGTEEKDDMNYILEDHTPNDLPAGFSFSSPIKKREWEYVPDRYMLENGEVWWREDAGSGIFKYNIPSDAIDIKTAYAGSQLRTLILMSNGDLYVDETKMLTGVARIYGKQVSYVSNGALIVKTNGDVYAMGENSFGQLGIGTTTDALVPKKVILPSAAKIS